MSAHYSPLPTTAPPNGYPPAQTKAKTILARLTPTAPPTRIRRVLVVVAVLALSSTLLVYLVFSSSFPPSWSSSIFSSSPSSHLAVDAASSSDSDPSSPWFRDPHPALHARLFLARAQAEIKARGLDTCDGRLSGKMVDGYIDATLPYCAPTGESHASITCFPVRAPGSPNSWWPYTQSFCASQNLAHEPGWGDGDIRKRSLFTGQCALTDAGRQLKNDMGRENFLGTEFREGGAENAPTCGETVAHPVLFVPRQDQWNPFHVGEDLVTTFLALTIFSRHTAPDAGASRRLWRGLPAAYASGDGQFVQMRAALEKELEGAAGLQLVFQDGQLPTQSLFAPMYDRIGAWTARRTAADALGVDNAPTCFTTAFHSVGAGASLLSGTGVGREFKCASELVWGASLWLRWLWGLERNVPGGAYVRDPDGGLYARAADAEVGLERRAPISEVSAGEPIQVLFLSRDKFDAYTRHNKQKLSPWQEARHISNERDLLKGLRAGLAGLCRAVTEIPGIQTPEHTPGGIDCTYTDADDLPGAWGAHLHSREARALGLTRSSSSPSLPSPHSDAAASGSHHEQDAEPQYPERRHSRAFPFNATTAGWEQNSKRATGGARALRFATLDPTTTALASQLGMVGRTDVVVSVHAGALGLTLYMPTGRASVVELVPSGALGNQHFHNMAHMMGMEYLHIDVQKQVDVPAVVRAVTGLVERRLRN